MIITVTGFPGAGNSSVAQALAKKLGYKHYSGGDIRRKIAREHGITLAELNRIGETEPWTDVEVDDYIKNIARKEDNFILDSKIGNFLIPTSFKIFLIADVDTRAERVFNQFRKEEKKSSIKEIKSILEQRVIGDRKRYKKYYNIETYTGKGFDFVFDTTGMTVEQSLDIVFKEFKSKNFK